MLYTLQGFYKLNIFKNFVVISFIFCTIAGCSGSTKVQSPNEESGYFPLSKVRSIRVDGEIEANLSIDDGIVLVSLRDSILAIELSSGLTLWKAIIPSQDNPSPVVICNNLVFSANSSDLRALDLHNGKIIWKTPFQNVGGASILACSGNTIIIDRVSLAVDAYDLNTGKLTWEVLTGRGIATAFVQNDLVYVWFGDQIGEYDLSSGKMRWTTAFNSTGKNVILDDVIYYNGVEGAQKNHITAFDIHQQVQLWDIELAADVNSVSVSDNYVLIGTNTGIIALSKINGERKWETNLGSEYQPPVLVDNIIYSRETSTNRIYSISESEGSILGYIQLTAPPLLFEDTTLGLNSWEDSITQKTLLVFGDHKDLFIYGK